MRKRVWTAVAPYDGKVIIAQDKSSTEFLCKRLYIDDPLWRDDTSLYRCKLLPKKYFKRGFAIRSITLEYFKELSC